MVLPLNLKQSKKTIIFLTWTFLLFFLLGCNNAAEDSYGKTYGIDITSPSEQKNLSNSAPLDDADVIGAIDTAEQKGIAGVAVLRNYSMQNISKELEGAMEGNLVILVMRLNKSNLTVYSVIPKDIKFNRKPKTANVYFFQLLDASERGLFVGGIPGLESAYDPNLDGEQFIPDPAGVDKIVSSSVSFIIEFPYYKNATVLRVIRVEKKQFTIVGDVMLK
ncbi:hypothetical protein HYY71_06300 [Candidatus Woesearchaeota archaeon]|nr:hypothetical protein [Candidatus Woesearchaeota archaeon]